MIKQKDGKIIERVHQIDENNRSLVLKSYPLDDAKSI